MNATLRRTIVTQTRCAYLLSAPLAAFAMLDTLALVSPAVTWMSVLWLLTIALLDLAPALIRSAPFLVLASLAGWAVAFLVP